MNAYELAELTAELSRRGLTGWCRIHTNSSQSNTNDNAGQHTTVITKGIHRLATIIKRDGGYVATRGHRYARRGPTRAAALANLLDATP